MRTALWLILALGVPLAADAKEEAAMKELQKMEGTWLVTLLELNGEKATEEQNQRPQIKLLVKGDKYTVYHGEERVVEGTLKLDPTKKPKTMDIIADDGPNKGLAMQGIYELEGDTMKVCFAQLRQERPSEFRTKAGTNQMLFGYKRVKP